MCVCRVPVGFSSVREQRISFITLCSGGSGGQPAARRRFTWQLSLEAPSPSPHLLDDACSPARLPARDAEHYTHRMRGRCLIAAAAVAAAAAQQIGCSYDSGAGVSFDLSPLQSSTGYTMRDVNNKSDPSGNPAVTAVWEFRFSICQDMDGKAGFPGGPDASTCATTQSDDGLKSYSNPAPAFRYCVANCETLAKAQQRPCQRLGDSAANAQLLTHPWNLASGVTVQYTNGDNCTSKCVVVGAGLVAGERVATGLRRWRAHRARQSAEPPVRPRTSHVVRTHARVSLPPQAGRQDDPALAACHHVVCGQGARAVLASLCARHACSSINSPADAPPPRCSRPPVHAPHPLPHTPAADPHRRRDDGRRHRAVLVGVRVDVARAHAGRVPARVPRRRAARRPGPPPVRAQRRLRCVRWRPSR